MWTSPERTHRSDLVHSRECPAEHLACTGRIELRCAPGLPRKHCKTKLLEAQQRFSIESQRRRHGQLRVQQLLGEGMLFPDLLIRPAVGAVEFQDYSPFRAAELIHAVL